MPRINLATVQRTSCLQRATSNSSPIPEEVHYILVLERTPIHTRYSKDLLIRGANKRLAFHSNFLSVDFNKAGDLLYSPIGITCCGGHLIIWVTFPSARLPGFIPGTSWVCPWFYFVLGILITPLLVGAVQK